MVAIIGILATIVLMGLGDARSKARDARRVTELRQLVNAIEMYKLDNNGNAPEGFCYTDSCSHLNELISGGYLSEIPQDPKTGDGAVWRYGYCNYQTTGVNGRCDRLTPQDPRTYVISFNLEGKSGNHCIHATSGIYKGSDKPKENPNEGGNACVQED